MKFIREPIIDSLGKLTGSLPLASKDAFIPPKPFNSWVLDETTCWWEAPVAYPSDGKEYDWDEDNTQWVEGVR